ncbi:fused MFS/spermidine synthase [Allosphingosinicella vermicomposti]|uniref:fused MFS/spermidine synthase n=1 Tax=Allosphingosinicella vermicomposti TaxID=614671 RepID=UPI000D0F85FC|nr:fused MFS/spermidine synthase [Allosphingosinicella vermicomposti]
MADALAVRPAERFARPLFVATVMVGSFLLFLTQPMIARMALPRLGGAPAVWNSAMLVYQMLLLAGYSWAHWLARQAPRQQAGLHLALFAIAALWLPIGLNAAIPPAEMSPALWVPYFLVTSMGPLFLAVSAQAPLMQHWYALESDRGEPYALYAASNLGSFGGLITYPLLVEPFLSLHAQSWLWTGGYALLAVMLAACAATLRHVPNVAHDEKPRTPAPSRGRILYWMALAAVPSGLMLSTTTHLTTDIVAMPLLWVVPLALYLLSFVIAFATRRGPTDFITQIAPVLILLGGGFAFFDGSQQVFLFALLGLVLLFTIAVALHGELYRLRPAADRLTTFYLVMSVGGMLGGLFCALLAPAIFDWTYEHPILILAAAFLVPQRAVWSGLQNVRAPVIAAVLIIAFALSFSADTKLRPEVSPFWSLAATTVIALAAVAAMGRRALFAVLLGALMLSHGGWAILNISRYDTRIRSYFGVFSVGDRGEARVLTHGTTLHGLQDMRPGRLTAPTTYYAPKSGVGQIMSRAEEFYGPQARIGVVGLGTGTLSCYKRPAQNWTFFEIDPKMARLARDSGYFTFLANCAPDARIVLGDARIRLTEQPPQGFDILAIDAFSSDSVPMHLLTREALQVYGRALQQKGIALFHISNRYIELEPVIAKAARDGGWQATLMTYSPNDAEEAEHATTSLWIALSRDGATIDGLRAESAEGTGWQDILERPGFDGWTDDFGSILPLLKAWED